MPAFEYVALDQAGKTRKGVEEGDSSRQVRGRLRYQGLMPMSVNQVAERHAALRMPVFQPRVKPLELALATRQMATLARAGMPIEEVLGTVARQSEAPKVKATLSAVRTRVMEGLPLAHAMGEFPSVFPAIYRTTISAGEQAGRMDLVLERLADNVEAQNAMRQKIQQVLMRRLEATHSEFWAYFSDSKLVRVQFILNVDPGRSLEIDPLNLESEVIQACRSWNDDLAQQLRRQHGLPMLLVLGDDLPEQTAEFARNADLFVAVTSKASDAIRAADFVLPATTFAEAEGTFTNHEGRVQRFWPAVQPPPLARPAWQILGVLLAGIEEGVTAPATAGDAFVRLGDWHAEYSGLSYDLIGSRGALMNDTVRLPAGAGGD